ncbi:LlaMI family restriction endonuclease [Brochothrix thermosphacta]|uniref:LlaMI family restriction endonuclease n=1 Tax=Brochothrix thermosphacta TaxID=2756 RepID=UPI0027124300|nr:LlaMI family restriction endonuclease [Brochothrix thermosphacta]MDO7865185.1 LlaMI family restriction endonuclease [Brochothrix thermosphacta]
MNQNKERIIELFKQNVKGKVPDVTGRNERHDGKDGHWLEKQFGISANATNGADFLGYELKNETTSKTTFGDWSANKYIFKQGTYIECFSGNTASEKQDSFCRIFGKSNLQKNGRYSWSGSPVPKVGRYNTFGQILIVEENLDIVVKYSYSQDLRPDKAIIVPKILQQEELLLCRWYGESTNKRTDKCLKAKLEDKFNDLGWFTCKKNSDGIYERICFGEPMIYENWIKLVKQGVVFFDSGMYQGNKRPYSQWRANNSYWDSLITENYT